MNDDEPVVTVHGQRVPQSMILMVESHLLAGVEFAHDGLVLADPLGRANPDALELFADSPLGVALALEWLRQHQRLPRDAGASAS